MGLKLKLGLIVVPAFSSALLKLGQTRGLNAKDVYALTRTITTLEAENRAYQKAHLAAVQKHGAKVSPEPAWPSEPTEANVVPLPQAKAPAPEKWRVDPNGPNWEAFTKEMDVLAETEVEVFLDHKVKLSDGPTPLTAEEMSLLMDLVEI